VRVERLLRPELPNVLVEVRHGPFPSNIVPEFLKLLSIDCPTIVCVHQLEYLAPLLIVKLLCTSTFSILFVEGYELLVGDGTTIVLVDAIEKVLSFGMVQRAGHPLEGTRLRVGVGNLRAKGTKNDAEKNFLTLSDVPWFGGKLGM
jgi:hypothetical protein